MWISFPTVDKLIPPSLFPLTYRPIFKPGLWNALEEKCGGVRQEIAE
jgi:hypothetical protein